MRLLFMGGMLPVKYSCSLAPPFPLWVWSMASVVVPFVPVVPVVPGVA